ncbi:MAG: isochorismatase [Alphaproteobacteria bacterium HGW-Alphaproteobacteria-2]|nr:MAG: isochorismatase [Alphaproteobacteria bacterium HGW-Alphaproteobacteria-2]
MHQTAIRQQIIDRVTARRGRLHIFDHLDPARTALVVIDMQNTFVAPGAPAEVPAARGIVEAINRLASGLRARGGAVIWISHANIAAGNSSDWAGFFERFVAADVRRRTVESLAPGGEGQRTWPELDVAEGDIHLVKNRYSALIPGSSNLERALRSLGLDTLLIAGTKTNVCCESTARDAMMLDFNVVMVSDACAALSDEEHRATLETAIQNFGDVLSAEECLALMPPAQAI